MSERRDAINRLALPLHEYTVELIKLDQQPSRDIFIPVRGITRGAVSGPHHDHYGVSYCRPAYIVQTTLDKLPARMETLPLIVIAAATAARLEQLLITNRHPLSKIERIKNGGYEIELNETDVKGWESITYENIMTTLGMITTLVYPTRNENDAIKILKEANSPMKGYCTTPLEMLSNTINGFWGPVFMQNIVFPQVVEYIGDQPKISMDFIRDIHGINKAWPDQFNGGCPNRFSVVRDLDNNKINLGESTIRLLMNHFIKKIEEPLPSERIKIIVSDLGIIPISQ